MKVVASPYHQKLNFPSKEGIVVIRGKQENTRYFFGQAVRNDLAEQRPTELAKSLQARGKNDVAEENELKETGKRKCETVDKPEASHQRGNVAKN